MSEANEEKKVGMSMEEKEAGRRERTIMKGE